MKQKVLTRRKLIVFTSLFASKMGGIKDLLVLLGKEKEARAMHKQYQKVKLFGPWGLEQIALLYQGFSEKEISEVVSYYCQKKIIKGMEGLVSDLKSKGFTVGALSSDPFFMMDEAKKRLSFDFIEGCHLEVKDGKITGKMNKKVDRYEKAKIVREKIKDYGLDKKEAIAIGRATAVNIPTANEVNCFVGFDLEKEAVDNIIKVVRQNKIIKI